MPWVGSNQPLALANCPIATPSHSPSDLLLAPHSTHILSELHLEALKLVDDESSALVGTEFAGWLAPKRQRKLSIVDLSDNNGRDCMAERAGC
jgi:hypothetical protein